MTPKQNGGRKSSFRLRLVDCIEHFALKARGFIKKSLKMFFVLRLLRHFVVQNLVKRGCFLSDKLQIIGLNFGFIFILYFKYVCWNNFVTKCQMTLSQ